jgi:hypothetical protein
MGLAKDLGHSKMKAIIWVLTSSGFGGDIWTRIETPCEYLQKQSKALNRQGNEVTSFAQYVINQSLDLKQFDTIKIKLKDSSDLDTDTEPTTFCFDVISVMGCPTYEETVKGALPSEWVVMV